MNTRRLSIKRGVTLEKIAINFDSSYTSIYKLGSGIVLHEATVAAVSADGKNVLKAFGNEAKKLIGKTAENTKIVFPIFEGEIVNEGVASKLLACFLEKIIVNKKYTSIHAVFSVPCGTEAEILHQYEKVAKNAGISKVSFVEAPLLSALGQRVPISDSTTCFLIDMASGNTNIGAISLDGIIAGISVNFGANKIATDIIDYLSEVNCLQVGLLTSERIRKEIGSLADNDGLSTVVNGRDLNTGTPKAINLRAIDIQEAVKPYYDKISELAMDVLVKLPPEVSAEIRHSGVYVSGVGADVYGLEAYLNKKFNMKVNIAENADLVVALGGGIAVGNQQLLKKISIKR